MLKQILEKTKKYLYIYSKVTAIQFQVFGMHWENEQRKQQKLAMAYGGRSFEEAANEVFDLIEEFK